VTTEGRVRIVGTAHVSPESVQEVEETIADERPDVVAVELDEDRYRRLRGEDPGDDLAPRDLLHGGVIVRLLAYWLLSYVQARLADRFGVEPGADMRAAIESAEAIDAEVALVDRDIQVTVQRLLAAMSLWAKLRLLWALLLDLLGVGDDVEVDIEEFTDTDAVSVLLEEFRALAPGAAEALIDERDAYIAHRLVELREAGHHVVAVVGAGHEAGIERYLDDPDSLPPRDSLTGAPEGGIPWGKLAGGAFTVAALCAFGLLALAGVEDALLLRVAGAWVAINGVFALAFARAAGARWTSAGVGGAVAWMTSINPLLAPGWFVGYLELRHRPAVRMADVGRLNDLLADTERPLRAVLRDMLEVPLFRLVVIVAATNVASVIASALFVVVVLPWFGGQVGGIAGVERLLLEGLRNGLARVGL
jgi:pheromone shutdown-related protein TraB